MNIIARLRYRYSRNNYVRISILRRCGARIGIHCEVFRGASLGSEPYLVSMGNHVKLTDGVKIITHDGALHVFRGDHNSSMDRLERVIIGNNVFIGNNVIVLPGSMIGDDIIIGAGAVVGGVLDSGWVYAGIPARKIRTLDDYYKKHNGAVIPTHDLSSKKKWDYWKRMAEGEDR